MRVHLKLQDQVACVYRVLTCDDVSDDDSNGRADGEAAIYENV